MAEECGGSKTPGLGKKFFVVGESFIQRERYVCIGRTFNVRYGVIESSFQLA